MSNHNSVNQLILFLHPSGSSSAVNFLVHILCYHFIISYRDHGSVIYVHVFSSVYACWLLQFSEIIYIVFVFDVGSVIVRPLKCVPAISK